MEVYPDAGLDVPYGIAASAVESGEQERLNGLLREATQLIERSDLGRASEKLREAGEIAASRDARALEEAG